MDIHCGHHGGESVSDDHYRPRQRYRKGLLRQRHGRVADNHTHRNSVVLPGDERRAITALDALSRLPSFLSSFLSFFLSFF